MFQELESERDEDDGDEKALKNKAAGDEATVIGEFTTFAGMSIQRWQVVVWKRGR